MSSIVDGKVWRVLQVALAHAIEHLIDIGNAILPQRLLPLLGRERILQHTTVAIEGDHLAALLLDGHLLQQILDTLVDRALRIFVDILATILIEVYPPLVVDIARRLCHSHKGYNRQNR